MKRRAFFASLAALTLDPERLLWVPGKKLISIPKPVVRPLLGIAGFTDCTLWEDGEIVEFKLRTHSEWYEVVPFSDKSVKFRGLRPVSAQRFDVSR